MKVGREDYSQSNEAPPVSVVREPRRTTGVEEGDILLIFLQQLKLFVYFIQFSLSIFFFFVIVSVIKFLCLIFPIFFFFFIHSTIICEKKKKIRVTRLLKSPWCWKKKLVGET